jgi:molybdenum cofactor cytidylyltransferase
LGAPALFDKSIFAELLQLKGDTGTKTLIQKYMDNLEVVAFEKGNMDIDTTADYQELSRSNND